MTMRMGHGLRLVAGMAALAVVAAGCGDDDDETASSTAEYCELATEIDTQQDFPSVEQLEALQDAAPEEISDEADLVVPVFVEAIEAGDPEAAFEDPIVQENFGAIEAFDADECGLGSDEDDDSDEGDGEGAAVNPEFEDYCAIARELDEQEGFPTADQLEEIRSAAPDEISDEISTVADAFLAGIEAGDPAAAFNDPAVEEAFGPIEAFETENCGLHGDDDEGAEQDPSVTEPDPDAAQVAVTATDYAFAFDPPVAGRTSFTMTNAGEERHVMLLFRLAEGFTVDDVLESEGDEGAEEELESDTAAAGEEAVLTADLVPGVYGMICFLPDADGTPHFELGMVSEFTIE
jgi:hypothetical protein